MDKPEALRLEDVPRIMDNANAELRRLHEENEVMRNVANRGGHIAVAMSRIADLEAQRDALLEALRVLLSYANVLEMRLLDADGEHRAMQKARAAIKAVEENT